MRAKKNVNGLGLAWGARVAGALLLLCALGLIAWNERRVMDYSAALSRHGSPVLDLGAAGRPAAGQYGSTTRVSGMPQVVDAPRDNEFNVRSDSPVLVRHVEMFQWREITVGGATHYEMDWVDHPIDATGFAKPAGHVNPGAFPIQGRQFEAGEVRLGNFRLATEIVRDFPGRVQVPVDGKSLPANLAATFTAHDGDLVTSSKPDHPHLGDLRVSWEAVPLQDMTVVARIDGDTLVPGKQAQPGDAGFDVQVGERSLLDVIPALPEPPGAVAIVRGSAYLLAMAGALLLACGGRFRRDILFAVGVGMVAVSAVAGAMWLAGDAMTASVWLLFAVLGAGLAIWRVQQRTARGVH
ncbi:TMEM43 family protein [Luteibacter aegosomatissinici]|uniref:TMEM43 family protein n=1 Tax=Luteibacter aegosomatissinici TaxID=2911539 RepID=UPI001FF761C5|nr:TMEM43 family protein [Luteibacter aegosomatissinici]UPG93512.1 TMEM43 family protein [Luteibacter aegosomatissinici]